MKKILTVLFCTFVFLFNDIGVADSNTIDKAKLDEKVSIKYEVEAENEEQETTVEEQKEDSTIVDTSTTAEYVEEVNTINETYTENYETYSVNYGTYGRLYVSWYDVALYDYNVYTESSSSLQQLVDNYDSAAYYINYGKLVIADHNYQGFNVLNNLSEGNTAYIKFADGSTITYRLIKREKGYNTGPDLVDTAGNSFFDMSSDLIMYTCYDDGIMVTLWVLA